jgi:glyoxylase-like metal-dependent hydrolase (beta-lactamase superfamily II)
MLISGGEALVVDPGRDIFTYVETAEKEGVKITGVWLSHSHADFIAGHMEFAARLNVPLYISAKAQAAYPHKPLREGDTLSAGRAMVRLLETPGHTPDSMCGVVYRPGPREAAPSAEW